MRRADLAAAILPLGTRSRPELKTDQNLLYANVGVRRRDVDRMTMHLGRVWPTYHSRLSPGNTQPSHAPKAEGYSAVNGRSRVTFRPAYGRIYRKKCVWVEVAATELLERLGV
jgi:hypothetical protein